MKYIILPLVLLTVLTAGVVGGYFIRDSFYQNEAIALQRRYEILQNDYFRMLQAYRDLVERINIAETRAKEAEIKLLMYYVVDKYLYKLDGYKKELIDVIYTEASAKNIPPLWIIAMIYVESKGDHQAVSYKGAKGIIQVMDSAHKLPPNFNVFNPMENVRMGIRILAEYRDKLGSLKAATIAYNIGITAYLRAKQRGQIPLSYYNKILSLYENFIAGGEMQ